MTLPDTTPTHALRILHVSEVHWGGVITLLRSFTEQQVAEGHEVHVLGPVMPPLPPGVHVHEWSLDRRRPWTAARALGELRNLVSHLRPDVVHLHSFIAGNLGRLPFGLSGMDDIPVIYQPHAWSHGLFAGALGPECVRLAEKVGARRTTLIVTNCQDEIDEGVRLGVQVPGRPLGVTVDLARFRPPTPEERREARQRLGLDDRRVALVLGRLARQKGQDLLLPVWERHRPDDTLLALVGPGDEGPLAPLAPTQWGRSVVSFGVVDDVIPWLWASDVLLLSSRYETVALVVAEALATGLPVVATAVDGAAEAVVDGPDDPAGAVVPLDDMEALLDALERRLADPVLHQRESQAGPQRARRMFDPPEVAARLESAYREAQRRVATTAR